MRLTSFFRLKSAEAVLILFLIVVMVILISLGVITWKQPERLGLVVGSIPQLRWMNIFFTSSGVFLFFCFVLIPVLRKTGIKGFHEQIINVNGDDVVDKKKSNDCLLYTSDAADDTASV